MATHQVKHYVTIVHEFEIELEGESENTDPWYAWDAQIDAAQDAAVWPELPAGWEYADNDDEWYIDDESMD